MSNADKPKLVIDKIKFNDENEIKFGPSDIVVFVGPNNAGKSQVLKDINAVIANNDVTRVIAKTIDLIRLGDPAYFEEHLVEKNGSFYFENIGFDTKSFFRLNWNNQVYHFFQRYLLKFLSTEERLKASDPVDSYDVVNRMPQNPIQELYTNDAKEFEICDLFKSAFGQDIIVNRGGGTRIAIHVGQKPLLEPNEDRVSKSYLEKLQKIPQVQKQGDGIRSFLGILLNVFVNPHPLILIDEPEAFLHPPQARLLGKILASKLHDCQIFISSHSGDFIKGLLDSGNSNVKIIHIDRDMATNINHMKLLDNDGISQIWRDPLLRYSNILDGLFHSKVVICESDSDCRFYQALMNACYSDDGVSDILFVHCGGKQRLKVVVDALRALDVKTMVVADIDVLNDKDVFKSIVESFCVDWNSIEGKWKSIDNFARQLVAPKNKKEVKEKIDNFFESISETTLSHGVSEKIEEIVKFSSGWSSIKKVGKRAFTGGVYTDYITIEDECKSRGLLIVPVGELEHFYKPFEALHGPEWTNKVLERVDLLNDDELHDAREFVKSIFMF